MNTKLPLRMDDSHNLTPAVRTLKGLLANTDAEEADYYKYLEEKYL